jgi:hypothetical protein
MSQKEGGKRTKLYIYDDEEAAVMSGTGEERDVADRYGRRGWHAMKSRGEEEQRS